MRVKKECDKLYVKKTVYMGRYGSGTRSRR